MPTYSGVIAGNLNVLDEVLWEWASAQERSARIMGWEDAPWWYNERASVSTLAGAVWRAGGIVLEEHSTEKKHNKEQQRSPGRRLSRGRGDMYFCLGRRQFILEGKQAWPSLKPRSGLEGLRKKLSFAKCEVKRTEAYGARRLAALFAAPYLPISLGDRIESLIEEWLKTLKGMSGISRAWMFPERSRELKSERAPVFYPGAVLLLQEVK